MKDFLEKISWLGAGVVTLMLSAGVLLHPSGASAAQIHPLEETFGSAAQPSFIEAEGMAVDQSTGDLLVIDGTANTVSRWNADGTPANFSALGTNVIDGQAGGADETPQGGLSFGGPSEVQIAIDNSGGPNDGNIYVPQASVDEVYVFDEDGSFLEALTKFKEGPNAEGPEVALKEPCGVAVDEDGAIYVGDFSFSEGAIRKYEPAAEPPVNADSSANFPSPTTCTVAAGAGPTDGFIFKTEVFSGEVKKLDSATGEEEYVVTPGPTTTVSVDPVGGFLYAASGNEVKEFDASGASEATQLPSIMPGGEKVTGIAINEAGEVYVAHANTPQIEVWGPTVLVPDVITEEASVINGTVTLRGAVNPAGGAPASCFFEYVEVSANDFEGAEIAPCVPAGPFSGSTSQAVSAEVSGLPEAGFRFRLVGENENGQSPPSETLFFNTFEQISGLPDNRAYELVSPPQKAGEVIPPEPVNQLGGSCGDCVPGANSPTMPMQSTPEGNAVLYLGQPFSGGLASGPNEYIAPRSASGWGLEPLSTPTMTGGVVAFSKDLLRGMLSQGTPTLSPQAPSRGETGFSNLYLLEGGTPTPLITTEPPTRNPGNFEALFSTANAGSAFVPAFEHVVFEADDALSEEAPAVPAGECTLGEAECNLYEWTGGELRLVNVLPDKSAAGGAVVGAGRLLATIGDPDLEPPAVDHAISDDGSRIFWSSEETGEVYVRVEGKETLQIPGPGSCKKSVSVEERACFLTASPDGSSVLLADGSLYELNEAGTAYEQSADLSEEKGGFEGILGAAEDLSRIYFVDTEVLSEEENENEEQAEEGEFNLYAWDEGEPTFIGMLAAGDNGFGTRSYGAWTAAPANRTAQVSADGSRLAFMSLAQLTGYDSTLRGGGNCSSGGVACGEVFIYSADSESLTCASCNPSGQQPLGPSNLSLLRPDAPFPQPRNLSRDGSGRVFFESQDTLVAGDSNGNTQDIYEWEPQGVGSCEREAGCVYLISSGKSSNDSMFLDGSESGGNAFFITREQLLPQDKNQQLDLYDARIGGGFEEIAQGPCSPEACAGPLPSPPTRPSFGSAGFSGPTNPKPKHCKPGFVKKQGKCVKKHKKKKKQATHSRRSLR